MTKATPTRSPSVICHTGAQRQDHLSSSEPTQAMNSQVKYLLHLADNALILAQRNAQWTSNAPTLEEDIALANQSLDLIGQSRLLYQEGRARNRRPLRLLP
jgi:1,2-phenylacetyl-CoA epoxidase catalytic subunit